MERRLVVLSLLEPGLVVSRFEVRLCVHLALNVLKMYSLSHFELDLLL